MTPLILINGLEDFNTPFFDENKHLIGQISALFAQKDGSNNRVEGPNTSDKRTNKKECDKDL
ncbi:19110_t:CDS:2 [Entrophospora sp. SA101]|nr:19110_t:CDS:2 [Entrophospora sp. SA101]